MPRPQKCRRVAFLPNVTYFKPAGIPLRVLEEIQLSVEEAEAIRLKDVECLEQKQAAEKMNISRPTFQRILISSRRKIADALLNGKAIKIEGGKFEMASSRFRCLSGHEWEVPFEAMVTAPPVLCPVCNTSNVMPLQPIESFCNGRGRPGHHGRRHGGMNDIPNR
jgi:predicted DNA-binding protein (UPF0251 family)